AAIGNLSAEDPDSGTSLTFTTTDGRFEIVGTQLRLKSGQSLDFETTPTVSVSVTATDNGTPSLALTQSVVIAVTDVNEAPTSIGLSSNTVSENAFAAIVGTVTVVDPDAGDTRTFALSDDRFEIVSGQLKLKNFT